MLIWVLVVRIVQYMYACVFYDYRCTNFVSSCVFPYVSVSYMCILLCVSSVRNVYCMCSLYALHVYFVYGVCVYYMCQFLCIVGQLCLWLC